MKIKPIDDGSSSSIIVALTHRRVVGPICNRYFSVVRRHNEPTTLAVTELYQRHQTGWTDVRPVRDRLSLCEETQRTPPDFLFCLRLWKCYLPYSSSCRVRTVTGSKEHEGPFLDQK